MSKKRLAILGSGWGGYAVAKRAGQSGRYAVSVISPRNHFLFTPLLPSTAVGTLEFRCIQEPIRTLQGVKYFPGAVTDIDFSGNQIHCQDVFKKENYALDFDKLVIAIGMTSNTFGVQGLTHENHVYFLRQLSDSRSIRNRLLECFERAANPFVTAEKRRQLLSFVVVGGGPTSIEFAAELYDFIKSDIRKWYPDLLEHVQVTLIEASDHILGAFDDKLVKYTTKLFKKRQIKIITKAAVKEVKDQAAYLSNDTVLKYGLIVWSTGVAPSSLTQKLSLKTENGRFVVDDFLHVESAQTGKTLQNVYALGDCAISKTEALAPLAQVANQQGAYLGKLLNSGDDPVPFKYTHFGSMCQVGNWDAVIDTSKAGLQGFSRKDAPKAFTGFFAFIAWRSAYWTRTVSWINKILIPMYWFKTMVFGRDISRF